MCARLGLPAVAVLVLAASALHKAMGRRSSKKARKSAKRQSAHDKKIGKQRAKAIINSDTSPSAAAKRMALHREAVSNGEPPAPRGLVNLGNTCFFNAVMQCLTRVALFREHFVFKSAAPAEGAMTTALRGFLVEQWKVADSSVFNPNHLFLEVGKKNPSFKGRAQQDAHELMKVVFDAVIDEEKARLAKVARGILPPCARDDDNDCRSENSHSTSTDFSDTLTDENASLPEHIEQQSPSSVAQTACETVHNSADDVTQQVSNPEGVDTNEGEKDKLDTEEATSEDERPVPAEKLVTIIERTVGGVLSSTIVCKECGTRSAVSEPFLDLQVPLVPRDAPEQKAAKDSESSRSEATISCKLEKKNVDEKDNSIDNCEENANIEAKSELKELSPSAVVLAKTVPGPSPPLPPPPLPPPPRRIIGPATAPSGTEAKSGDLMQELRQKVKIESHSEGLAPDSVLSTERQLVLYEKPSPNEMNNEDVMTQIDDDDDEADCFPSLFDSEDGDEEDDAANNDVNDMTAFSTSAAAKENDTGTASSSSSQKRGTSTPAGPRRAPAFISSLFGGFGGISPAPHGYMSIVGSLEEFTKVEILEGDNAYGCAECNRREKLRVVMQRFDNRSITAKKIEAAAEVFADDMNGESDISAVEESLTRKGPGDSTDSAASSNSSGNVDGTAKMGTENTERQPVMMSSSPVTSSGSEGSLDATSEEEGELIIEEEVEEPQLSGSVRQRTLSREEEDALIKTLDVKVPDVRCTAEKRFVLERAPEVLAIQLKRFAQVGFRGGLRKISGHVEFPLELDLAPFVEELSGEKSKTELKEKSHTAKRKRAGSCPNERGKTRGYKYELTGVTVHGGSLSGGHYTAYVREGADSEHRGGWYHCNDSKIQRAQVRDVLKSEAYLLYYERVSP